MDWGMSVVSGEGGGGSTVADISYLQLSEAFLTSHHSVSRTKRKRKERRCSAWPWKECRFIRCVHVLSQCGGRASAQTRARRESAISLGSGLCCLSRCKTCGRDAWGMCGLTSSSAAAGDRSCRLQPWLVWSVHQGAIWGGLGLQAGLIKALLNREIPWEAFGFFA